MSLTFVHEQPTKKTGRPRISESKNLRGTTLCFRIKNGLAAELDALAKAEGISRHAMAQQMLEAALTPPVYVRDERDYEAQRDYRERRKAERARDKEYAQQHGIPVENVSGHRASAGWAAFQLMFEKAAWDRAVELLEIWRVGGKALGDCTRNDLLLAEREAREISSVATLNANAYAELARLVGAGTLRESNMRGQIIDVLRQRLPEPEPA